MPRIISVHSFRGGTSNAILTANLAATMAQPGPRVGVLDTDAQAPDIHTQFRLDEVLLSDALNGFVWGHPTVRQGDRDHRVPLSVREGKGEVFVMGRSMNLTGGGIKAADISNALQAGADIEALKDGFRTIASRLRLDHLLIDTHPGSNEELMISLAVSDVLLIVLRPEAQEYQAAAVAVDVARRLNVPKIFLAVDELPTTFDHGSIHEQVEDIYNTVVAGVLPHSNDVAQPAPTDIFCNRFPNHPWSQEIAKIARQITS